MNDMTDEKPVVDIVEPTPRASVPMNPADAIAPGFFQTLPNRSRPYLSLARIDRPVGIWLLALPCWIGLAFAAIPGGLALADFGWAALFAIGAVAMRGAGCTWNDITDRKIDADVARTAERPLPSGAITLQGAYAFLGVQVFIGFLVWLCLPLDAKLIALLAIPLVVAYPYMKRITFWPQAWLGLTLNWGVLVAAATTGSVAIPHFVLFLALTLWTVAYDTIYAMQDREDDALIGVKSTARLFGSHVVTGSFMFHLGATTLIALAGYMIGAGRMGAVAALVFLAHGLWQSTRLKQSKEAAALDMFKANVWAGVLVLVAFLIAALL